MAVDKHLATARVDYAADDIDQCRLAGPVRPEQAEYLTLVNFEVDILERLEATGVGLGQTLNRNLGVHAPYYTTDLRIRGNKTMLNIRMMIA
jgi:hypothetical protein